MNQPGPKAERHGPTTSHHQPPRGVPAPYPAADLFPAGPVRVRALGIAGAPIVLVILLALLTGAGHGGGGGGHADAAPGATAPFLASAPPRTGLSPQPSTPAASDLPFGATDTTPPITADPYGTTPPATAPVTATPSATATSGPPGDPATTVRSYFAAINSRDFPTAWKLGGRNLDSGYQVFVTGFADTASDTVSVGTVQGDTVEVTLDALHKDGTRHSYSGTYTVRGGVIVAAALQQIG